MRTVGAYEAKTHSANFWPKSRMARRSRSRNTECLSPDWFPIRNDFAAAAAAIDEWERYRDEHNVTLGGGITIRELIEEGRE